MSAPDPPAPWRMLLVAGMMIALYVAIAWVDDEFSPSLVVVVVAAVVGAAAGAGMARFFPHRPPRRPTPSRAAARSTFVGLVGGALILAQRLSANGMRWLLLGGIALMVGAAVHGWLVGRRAPRTAR